MAEKEEIQENEVPEESALAMSDEDIMNMPDPGEDEQVPEPQSEEEEDDGLQEEQEETTEEEVIVDSEEPEGEQQNVYDQAATAEESSEDGESESETLKAEPERETESAEQASSIDYEAEYRRLLAPFKANGRQMQVNGVDDALTLMQMGANYNKKMAGLKPNLRLLKMLEKNELLDESKINNLIDLSKQNPAAIQDLLQRSGIDPLDIDVDEESEYRPETYNVDDKEVELDGVLEDIQDTPTFNETIDIISNKWDGDSKKVLLENPELIKVINSHVESGIYNSIHEIIENERALGRLTNISDIQAYKHVGDVIQANGGFNPQQAPQPQATRQQPPAQKAKSNRKLKNRKRAAGSPKGSAGNAPAEFNPLSMSDEEFEKATANMLM